MCCWTSSFAETCAFARKPASASWELARQGETVVLAASEVLPVTAAPLSGRLFVDPSSPVLQII